MSDSKQRRQIGRQIRAFERAVELAEKGGPPKGMHPEVHKAMIAALRTEIVILMSVLDKEE